MNLHCGCRTTRGIRRPGPCASMIRPLRFKLYRSLSDGKRKHDRNPQLFTTACRACAHRKTASGEKTVCDGRMHPAVDSTARSCDVHDDGMDRPRWREGSRSGVRSAVAAGETSLAHARVMNAARSARNCPLDGKEPVSRNGVRQARRESASRPEPARDSGHVESSMATRPHFSSRRNRAAPATNGGLSTVARPPCPGSASALRRSTRA